MIVRILWVTPQRPDSGGGGGAHHEHELLRSLSKRHDIEVITTYKEADPLDDIPLAIVDGWDRRIGPTNKRERAWLELTAREPSMAWPMRSRLAPLRDAIAARHPELVHMMLGELAPALTATRSPATLLLFDSYTRHAEAALALERQPRRRALLRLELARCRRFERRWYQGADGLACVSDADAETIGQLVQRSVQVLPNPIPPGYFESPAVERSTNTVLFVGSMGYPPNVDALRWLVTEIWPEIERARPDATLLAVGRSSDDPRVLDELRGLLGDRLVVDVPDVRVHYWEAAVTIAPMRLGAGMKNKVVHAMACRCPVVTTSRGREGTGAHHGEHVLRADEATSLAAAVVDVLERPDQARARADRAHELVHRFTTDRVVADLEQWWHRALHHQRDQRHTVA